MMALAVDSSIFTKCITNVYSLIKIYVIMDAKMIDYAVINYHMWAFKTIILIAFNTSNGGKAVHFSVFLLQ